MNTNMPSSSEDAIDTMTENTWEATRQAAEVAKKSLKELAKATKKFLKKPCKTAAKAVGKAAKAAVKAVGKAAATAVKTAVTTAAQAVANAVASVVSFLVSNPVGWAIDILLIIILIAAIWIWHSNNKEVTGGGNGLRDEEGNLVEIMQDWDERLISSYYLVLSDHSYWYTIDDDTNLIQGNLNSTEQLDKKQRENNFVLTSTLIRFLDEKLNKNFVYGTQFIKPVYNTCSTGESKNGYCFTKELVTQPVYNDDGTINEEKSQDAGTLLAMSTQFERVYDKDDDKSGENLYKIQLDNKNSDKISKVPGVWDYGFAPIFHYVKNEDEWYVKNVKVQTIQYWDEEKQKYVSCKPDDCPEDYAEKVAEATKSKTEADKLNVEKTDNYLIDNVATFLGTLTTEIEMTDKFSGNNYYEDGIVDGQFATQSVPGFAPSKQNGDALSLINNENTLEILRDETKKKIIHIVKKEYSKEMPNDDVAHRWMENKKVDGVTYRNAMMKGVDMDIKNPGSKGYKEGMRIFVPLLAYASKPDGWGEKYKKWLTGIWGEDAVKRDLGVERVIIQYDDTDNNFKTCNKMDIVKGIPQEDGSLYTGNGHGFLVCKDNEYDYQYTEITANLESIEQTEGEYDKYGRWTKNSIGGIVKNFISKDVYEQRYLKTTYYYIIEYETEHPLKYTLQGEYWEKTYDYVDNTLKIKDMNNGQYIYDYINYYEVYVPEEQYTVDLHDYLDAVDDLIQYSDEELDEEYAGESNDTLEKLKKNVNKYRDLLSNLYGERIWLDDFWLTDEEYCNIEDNKETTRCQNLDNPDTNSELITEGYGIKRSEEVTENDIHQTVKAYHDEHFHTNPVETAFSGAASAYGFDKELLYAIAQYESGIVDGYGYSGGKLVNTTNAGIMGLNYDLYKGSHTVERLGNGTNKIIISEDSMDVASKAIPASTAVLRELTNHYQGNILMAIQAYGQSQEAVDYAIKETAANLDKTEDEIMANYKDLTWSNYVYLSKFDGDPLYLPNVLQYFYSPHGDGSLKWQGWNQSETKYTGNQTLPLDSLYYQSQGTGMTLAQQLNWYSNKATIEKNFKFLYDVPGSPFLVDLAYRDLLENTLRPGSYSQKYNETDKINLGYTLMDTVKTKYFVKGADSYMNSDLSINTIIAQFLASTDNGQLSDYSEITNDMWLEKFNQMFGSLKADDVEYKNKNYGDYFKEYPSSPLKSNFAIIRPYGFSDPILNSQNIYTRTKHNNIAMMGKKETSVYPIASGVIDSISGNTVTIKHPELNDDANHETYTIYGELKVDDKIYIGQAVTNATVIGVVDNDMADDPTIAQHLYEITDDNGETEMGYITIELIHDDIIEDPTWIIRLAKALHEDAYGEINHAAQGMSLESARRMQQYILEHVDEIEAEFEDLSLEDGETFEAGSLTVPDVIGEGKIAQILGIAWTYSGVAGDTAHEGIDISPHSWPVENKKGTEIVTFAKSLLIAFYDGFPDTGYVGNSSANWGAANYIILMVKDTAGNWYQFDFLHCQQNQEIHLSGYEQTPVLEKGTFLGMVGNSGSSSGYHTHLQIHFLGHMSLKDIIETDIKNFNKFYMLSWGQNAKTNPNHRCENNSYTAPCFIKPHEFLNATYKHSYTGTQKVLFSNISSYIPNDQIDNFDGTF